MSLNLARALTRRFATQATKKSQNVSARTLAKEVRLGLTHLDDEARIRWQRLLKTGKQQGLSDESCARQFRLHEERMKDYMLSKKHITGGQDLTREDFDLIQVMDANYIQKNPEQYVKNFPYRFKWSRPWRESVDQVFYNLANRFHNSLALYGLATENSIPGVDTARSTLLDRYLLFPLKALRVFSVKPNTWSAPLRETALDTYKRLNTAITQQDHTLISLISRDPYRSSIPQLNKQHTHIWRFHKEITPTRLISVRIFQGNFAQLEQEPPSRFVMEMLVRFDTEQSMEIYTKDRKPLHQPDPDYPRQGHFVPAKRKRVTEYLVLHNRLWASEQWVVKGQLWPKVGLKVTV